MTPSSDHRKGNTWRKLRFESIADCKAEVERILAADQQGQLQSCGKWTAGQNLSHIAAWIEYAYEGYPIKAPPFFIRWILKIGLRKMLENGMTKGVRIPGIKEGTTGMENVPTSQAAERLLAALDRLSKDDAIKEPSPAFGAMPHQDRIKLNLRHAELHLGFLNY